MDEQSTSFEKALETDIQHLAAEIQSQREKPEMQNMAEQELVKEAIRAFPETAKNSNEQVHASAETGNGNSTTASSASASDSAASPLPAYAQSAPAEVKLEIEYLLDIALKKGIGPALTESQKSPAFVQDAFHDALVGRLYPELQKRGIVK